MTFIFNGEMSISKYYQLIKTTTTSVELIRRNLRLQNIIPDEDCKHIVVDVYDKEAKTITSIDFRGKELTVENVIF